jgi:ABC-type antimicrobial peptide transport system permease subunit
VEDYAEHDLRDPQPQVYFPYWAEGQTRAVVYLRTRAPLSVIAPTIRARVADIAPTLIVEDMRSVDEQIDRLLVVERMLSYLGAAVAAFGAILAMIGIYAVLSYAVQARSREMGIRLALGARASSATGLLMRDAVRLTVLGIVLAVPILGILGPLIQSRLYGVSAMSPLGLVAAAGAILAVCIAASAGPALRMRRVDPLQVFRVE